MDNLRTSVYRSIVKIHPSSTVLWTPTRLTQTAKKIGIEDYEMLGVIGEGAFAKVYHAVRKSDGEEFAIKTIHKRDSLSNK
jgi:serine/threonine protein kinase